MDEAPPPRRKRAELPLAHLLPNLITVTALCCGLSGIRLATEGRFREAILMVIIAAILDGMDGRLARLLNSESAIGAELDSLVDFVNFGVAPGLILHLWAFEGKSGMGWIAVLVYAVCCVLRLARFNVGSRAETGPAEKHHFRGVPSPAGAMLAMLPMYVDFMFVGEARLPNLLIAAYMIAIGGLMIGRMPTPSFKATKVQADYARYLLVGLVAVAAALVTYPWHTLVTLCAVYLLMVLWTWRRVWRMNRKEPPAT